MKKEMSPFDSGIRLKPGETVYDDGRVSKSLFEQKRALREIRGNIIAITIEMELALDRIISALLFPAVIKKELSENTKKTQDNIVKLFENFILKERPITFNSKITLLNKLLSEHPLLKDKEYDELIANLEKVRDIRNRFSHNTIAFSPEGEVRNQTLKPILTCYDKEIILDDKYFDSVNTVYTKTQEGLDKLSKSLI